MLDLSPFLAAVADLPADRLRQLARHYETLAREMADRADAREARDAMRADARSRINRLPVTVPAAYDAAVADRSNDPLETAAGRMEVPPETVAHYVRARERRDAARERAARDMRIMRMAARGWTNIRIGKELGLSAAHVGRIVRAQWKAGAP